MEINEIRNMEICHQTIRIDEVSTFCLSRVTYITMQGPSLCRPMHNQGPIVHGPMDSSFSR